jgi:hypothetical protein
MRPKTITGGRTSTIAKQVYTPESPEEVLRKAAARQGAISDAARAALAEIQAEARAELAAEESAPEPTAEEIAADALRDRVASLKAQAKARGLTMFSTISHGRRSNLPPPEVGWALGVPNPLSTTGATAPITPPQGLTLDQVEDFLATEPISPVEAMRLREAVAKAESDHSPRTNSLDSLRKNPAQI